MDINSVAIQFDADEEFEAGRQALTETLNCKLDFNDTTQFDEVAKLLDHVLKLLELLGLQIFQ